jgi:hypothetical protein
MNIGIKQQSFGTWHHKVWPMVTDLLGEAYHVTGDFRADCLSSDSVEICSVSDGLASQIGHRLSSLRVLSFPQTIQKNPGIIHLLLHGDFSQVSSNSPCTHHPTIRRNRSVALSECGLCVSGRINRRYFDKNKRKMLPKSKSRTVWQRRKINQDKNYTTSQSWLSPVWVFSNFKWQSFTKFEISNCTFTWTGIATRYGLDVPGIESRWGEISHTRPDRPWGPPSLLYYGYRLFPGGNSAGALTTQPI